MTDSLVIALGQHSEAGRKPSNQDFHGALIPVGAPLALKGVAVALADGISSSPVSHVAAQAAVKSFLTDYYCTSDAWSVRTAASRVLSSVNSWLHAETRRSHRAHDLDQGYVCTFAALVLKARRAHLFHVGDTRIWRVGQGGLEQLTQDHRVVLSSQENYLGRALGMAANVEIDYRAMDVAVGDTFILSTDGVHEYLRPDEMVRLLGAGLDLDGAARTMVAAALEQGSDDNLSIQIVRIDGLPAADPEAVLGEADMLPPPPLPGPRGEVDGYRVIRTLHANSRSHVYLAEPPGGGPAVVVKVPSMDLRGDQAYLRRFLMEEWIARRIDSAHVLKAAPAPVRRRSLYTVSEYVDGQSLRQWMIDHPHPGLDEVRGLMEQLEKGLRAFHRKEMLHQDLRPENVLIDRAGTAKIIDFGSTRVAGLDEAQILGADHAILGTQQYTAPEYFLGLPGTPCSDLFSLGVIAYEMLSGGRLPYGAEVSRAQTKKAQAKLRYRRGGTDNRPLADWVDAALRKAVHPDPAQRYQMLSEFTSDLRRPSPDFDPHARPSLMERDPLVFWKSLSAILALAVLILLLGKF